MLQCNLRKTRPQNCRPARLRSHQMNSKLLQDSFVSRHEASPFARVFASRMAAITLMLALFLGASAGSALAQRTIVVDAGHGGHDRGGVPYQRIGEKNLTLDVAKRLRDILEDAGYRVVMTRDGDYFVSLGQRVGIANSYRNATFISIHFNSARRSGANGIETYYYRSDSASLAANIHRNVVAVLVECGFLTNPTEGNLALTGNYRQKLADEIARGIRGLRAPINRPISRGSAASSEVLPQSASGPDFVRATPRAKKSSRHSKSHRKKKSSSKKKKKSSASLAPKNKPLSEA
jgi:N-acetylmuramoyl-L-alanine amidase